MGPGCYSSPNTIHSGQLSPFPQSVNLGFGVEDFIQAFGLKLSALNGFL